MLGTDEHHVAVWLEPLELPSSASAKPLNLYVSEVDRKATNTEDLLPGRHLRPRPLMGHFASPSSFRLGKDPANVRAYEETVLAAMTGPDRHQIVEDYM